MLFDMGIRLSNCLCIFNEPETLALNFTDASVILDGS
ncbi:hypothetical protein BJ928_1011320 [Rhizobium sp. WW_1]|nr:hypothetical protein BJ928_1011320 [Rhizobium sp. WW_1]